WESRAALSLVTTPNAPSGRGYSTRQLGGLCRATDGVVVLDEAYADFAAENAVRLALTLPNVIVLRTFSKAYSLCFQRIGYALGHRDLLAELMKVRDSYSVNGLGQVAALATLADRRYYAGTIKQIVASREQLAEQLAELGFRVLPSQTNFLLVEPPGPPAEHWFDALRERRILVRWFSSRQMRRYLRITIGTDEQNTKLLRALKRVLAE
ncbi:MAG: pyridoxal phosphate-dependent aminotransferase, partial [Gaiellaceae bacterium]